MTSLCLRCAVIDHCCLDSLYMTKCRYRMLNSVPIVNCISISLVPLKVPFLRKKTLFCSILAVLSFVWLLFLSATSHSCLHLPVSTCSCAAFLFIICCVCIFHYGNFELSLGLFPKNENKVNVILKLFSDAYKFTNLILIVLSGMWMFHKMLFLCSDKGIKFYLFA
ncbi:hypothetical protein KP509_07G025000 [Ceratopteris richardii]|uniref:Uncharacterized protein n=1 Tax=Ceratopteris richardii TaxID=49495 RepID=A0A8T2UAR9_CERRI|nr:hypothetical protein KP509_07G025000 [Ceratopteris richardii]